MMDQPLMWVDVFGDQDITVVWIKGATKMSVRYE